MDKTFKLEKEILNNILQRKIISPYNSFETIDGEFFAGNYLCEKNGHIVDYFDIKLIPFSELYKKEIYVKDINLLLVDKIDKDMKVTVKTRYSTKSANAKISESQNIIKIIFDEPQRAITPGQSAVFYLDDIVVGGGKILK